MAKIELKDLSKSYGSHKVLDALNLEIRDGEFVTIVGPSGCGKSTLLRIIAGLDAVSDGQLIFDGKVVNDITPRERGVAMVFQSYALYPHLSVFDNVAFGLKGRMPTNSIRTKVEDVLEKLQLSHLSKRLPKQLSGGQRQRVAIARAISREPGVMLFDEPLSNLDASLRNQTRTEIARLHRSLGTTTVYVTHDQAEAMTLSDKIAILNKGKIEQFGAPLEIYRKPINRFVAEFIGSPKINFISIADALLLPAIKQKLMKSNGSEQIIVGLRPHEIRAVHVNATSLKAKVTVVEEYGDRGYAYLETINSGTAVVVELTPKQELSVGDLASLDTSVETPLLISSKNGERLES